MKIRSGFVRSFIYLKFSVSIEGSRGMQIFPDLIIARYVYEEQVIYC